MKPNAEQLKALLSKLDRYESTESPTIYFKAVRVTLITLGYDEQWVNDEFRSMLEEAYHYCFEIYEENKKSQAGRWYPQNK